MCGNAESFCCCFRPLAGSQWVEKPVLEDRFQEKLADVEVTDFQKMIGDDLISCILT